MTAATDRASALRTRSETPTASRRRREAQVFVPSLPVQSAITARIPWLVVGALVGALMGAALAGASGSVATTSLQIINGGGDSSRVKQVAQTVQRLVTSSPVIQAAAVARGTSMTDLAARVSAVWVTDSDLVTVSVAGADAPSSVEDANAVAQAVVLVNQRDVAKRLVQLRVDANRLINSETLSNAEAEAARRAQIGYALASRQDAVSADAEGIVVTDPAVSADPAGLDRKTGAAAGLFGGLLLAMLLAILVGTRALRVRSARQVRALLPDVTLGSAAHAAELAGDVVESNASCLAIVALPGAHDAGAPFAMDVSDFVQSHGRTVTVIDTSLLASKEARRDVLRFDARSKARETLGTDILIVVVESRDEAFGMLVGQHSLRAAVVVRQRRTPFRALVRAISALEGAEPVVILTR